MPRRHALVAAAAVALQPFNGYPVLGPVSIADIALLGAITYVGGSQLVHADGWIAAGIRPLGILFGALTIWLAVVGAGWSATQFLAFAIVFGLISISVRDIDDVEIVLLGALAGSVVISLLTLFSIFFAPEFGGRVAGSRGIGPLPTLPRTIGVPIGSFGSFGTYALAPLGYALVRWHRTRDWRLAAASAIIISMVVVHQTRATYLALIVLLTVTGIGLFGRRVWVKGWRYTGASVIAAGGLVISGIVGSWLLLQVNLSNALKRFAQFDRAFELIVLYPLTGITPPVLPYFSATNNIPHNVILLVGVVGGVPAVTLLLATFGVAVAGLWRAYVSEDSQTRDIALGIAAGWAATLTNLSLAPGFTRAFWLLIGLGAVLVTVRRRSLQGAVWAQGATDTSVIGRLIRSSGVSTRSVKYPGHAKVRQRLQTGWRHSVVVRLIGHSAAVLGLTYDASEARRQVETAWGESAVQSLGDAIQRILRNATVIKFLSGRK